MSEHGFFNRYITPIRPLLLLALFLSVYIFVRPQTANSVSTIKTIETPTTNVATTAINTTQIASEPASSLAAQTISPTSLLSSLFGEGAVDPLFTLPDTTPSSKTGSAQSFLQAERPKDEPAQSIYDYLVAASNVGFEANPSRLGLALATAEQGELDALNYLISDFEKRLITYAVLSPPAELEDSHSASISLLERYITHMRNSRDRVDGTVVATWNNSERDAIAEDAARITQQIREIVDNYNISLPAGVLP